MKYIEIDKDLLPYRFDLQLKNQTYTFEIHYNAEYDFFTIDLYRGEEALVFGEKVVYGRPLFVQEMEDIYIFPYDITEQENRVTYQNLNEKVFLYVVTREELEAFKNV